MNANTMNSWSWLLALPLLVAIQQLVGAMEVCPHVNLFRLPTHVQPLNYKLYLRLDPSDEKFSGKVVIKMKFKEINPESFLLSRSIGEQLHPFATDPKKIILHSELLEVYGATFRRHKERPREERICHDAENKILVIKLSEEPNRKKLAWLTLHFRGEVKTETKGLYRSSIQSGQALVTQFEHNYARRVFPCFDEPEFRATFDLDIEHPMKAIALSNMPIIKVQLASRGFFQTTFEETPEMSSYLLGLAVGNFRYSSETSPVSKMPITIYVHEECAGRTRSVLANALQTYDKVSDYFGIKQPLKEVSILAVDTNIGAMENWGLITMKWEFLCTEEELMKPGYRNFAVTALTNVMVRFWLGNLVSVRWWDDLWFFEGLANYVTSELTAELHPEISSEEFTLMDTTYSAMNNDDQLQKTHPIQRSGSTTADEILELYDSFTYKKSEALFRMFAHFLGKDQFKLAIRDLVRSSVAEGSMEATRLWSDLAVRVFASHKSMLQNAYLWTQQAGYPIISVSIAGNGQLVFSQKSNLGDGKDWPVPISYEIHHASKGCMREGKFILTDSRPMEIGLLDGFNLAGGDQWLKLNPKYEGYYRVVYNSPELVEALAGAVKSGLMPPVDRMQLLSDFYDHAKRAGSEDDFGKVLKYCSQETNDGVILMLTKLLFDSHDNEWSLALSDEVKNLMMNYYELNGRVSRMDSNVLKQGARGQVLSYLVVVLEKKEVIEDVQIYEKENGRLLPYFEHVQEYLERLGARR